MTLTTRSTRTLVLLFSALIASLALTGEAAPKKAQKGSAKAKAAAGKYSAAIAFPAKGTFDPDQGTVEAVFSPSYSAGDNMGSGSGMTTFSMLSVCGPKGSGRGEDGLSWNVSVGQWQTGNYLLISSSRFERPIAYQLPINYLTCGFKTASGLPFKAGDWYSFAASWSRTATNYVLCLYFDGKCMTKSTMPLSSLFGTAAVDPKDLLFVGNPRVMRGSLESLRISKKVRTPAEIAEADKAGLVKDADTLLFIDAAAVAKMKTRPAEDLINAEEKTIRVPPEGVLFGQVDYLPGRKGKAMDFPR